MTYGHAERTLAAIGLLEAETRDLLSSLGRLSPEQAHWLHDTAESGSCALQSADVVRGFWDSYSQCPAVRANQEGEMSVGISARTVIRRGEFGVDATGVHHRGRSQVAPQLRVTR
jgi:hypothetical protein